MGLEKKFKLKFLHEKCVDGAAGGPLSGARTDTANLFIDIPKKCRDIWW